MKWTKVLLSVSALAAAGVVLVGKSVQDKKRKDELDAFLMPEEENTIQVDVPIKEQDVFNKIQSDLTDLSSDEEQEVSLSFQCTDPSLIDHISDFCSQHELSASFNLEDGLIDIDLGQRDVSDYTSILDELCSYFKSGSIRYLGAHYTKD